MTINEIENLIGKKLSEITAEDLTVLSENKDVLEALDDPNDGLAIVEEVLSTNPYDEVKIEFTPLKYHHLFYDAQIKLNQLFSQYAKDEESDVDSILAEHSEDILNSILEFLKGAAPLGKISAYLVLLTTFKDFDLKDYADDIQKTVKDVEEILFNLDMVRAFTIICELIDLLYTFQNEYFAVYQIDVINEDAEKMNEFIKKVDEFTQPIYDQMQKQINAELPEDAKPEDAGFLDITKFDNEKEN